MQPTVSKEKLSENQTPYISTDDLKEATERIDENGWKLQLRSQQKSAKKMTQVETAKTTQPATKVSSYKNPDYRSLPTYEAYLRSKSPTQVEIKSEDEPVDLSKIHYLGEYELFHFQNSFHELNQSVKNTGGNIQKEVKLTKMEKIKNHGLIVCSENGVFQKSIQ